MGARALDAAAMAADRCRRRRRQRRNWMAAALAAAGATAVTEWPVVRKLEAAGIEPAKVGGAGGSSRSAEHRRLTRCENAGMHVGAPDPVATADLDRLGMPLPEPELQARFDALQRKLVPQWELIEEFTDEPYGIVVVPSLSGVELPLDSTKRQAYEERYLFLLFLLRQPRAKLIYVTSQPIQPSVIDYYLGLLPGVVASHARRRLHLVSPHDGGPPPLSAKLLERPRLLDEIRLLAGDPDRAHLVPYNTTRLERDLALRLGIPMYGADPKFSVLGTKSGGRALFAEAGVPHPEGREGLRSFDDVVDAVLVVARELRSPSVQMRATPLGKIEQLSTHDQLLGGASGLSFLGSVFPASDEYARQIAHEALKVGEALAGRGVIGRFAVDFLTARTDGGWKPYAIELNLRKGGTTHPYLTLQFLTDGTYDAGRALFLTPTGEAKFFVSTDRLESEKYRVLQPDDVFDLAVRNGLHFDHTTKTGTVFHMMTTLVLFRLTAPT